jgi:hypothetical protein
LLQPGYGLERLTETAYHEAGHAVLARRLGYLVMSVTVHPDGSGHCSTRDPGIRLRSEADVLDVYLAGVAAEARLTGRWDWIRGASDLSAALELAERVQGWSSRRCHSRARVGEAAACIRRLFETDRELWNEVVQVAGRLDCESIRRGT